MPRILHVFSTFSVGGPQVRFAAIANHFGRAYQHAIIATDGDLACRARLASDLDVVFPTIEARKGDLRGNIRRHRQTLRELRPDALLTYNWGTIEWAMANALPPRLVRHVHVEDGFGPEERQRQLRRRVLTRRLVLRGCTVVLPSQTLWRIATETWRLNPRHLRFVPNSVDLDRFQGPARSAWPDHLPVHGPMIGTVAALRPEKNLARLLRAFRIARDAAPARLVIIGDGPERSHLETLTRQLGLDQSVHFAGHVNEPHAMFRGFNIFALSSDTEQMPLTVIEAMAAGLPVAATDVGDVRSMLSDENLPFVTALDDSALGASLTALVQASALRKLVGTANRAKAERDFDEASMFAAYAGLLSPPGILTSKGENATMASSAAQHPSVLAHPSSKSERA